MTEAELFERVLRELAELMLDLGDLSREVMLIGGQVLSVLSKEQFGTGTIEVTTETGIVVERGFSLEPDLLFDIGDSFQQERLTEVLRQRGFRRAKDYRWSKVLANEGGATIDLDLFSRPDVPTEELPTPMTPLPDAALALRRRVPVSVTLKGLTLRLDVPDAVAFIALKLRAKLEQRPHAIKDSFDLYAYVKFVGVPKVDAALTSAGDLGTRLRDSLLQLFWNQTSPGVRDVLAYASSLGAEEKDLLVADVVDVFADLGRT